MGYMKELDIRIRNGGDDAIAAAGELMPRWIPVTERLPEQAVWAVVWDSQNMIAVVAKRFGESDWCMSAGDEYGFESRGVTHWMPLPPPPEFR